MEKKLFLISLVALGLVFPVSASAHIADAVLLGPSPYLCFDNSTIAGCGGSDSPFVGLSLGYFHLETFEDHLFNTPGVSANAGGVTSVVFGPSIHDSVDEDDGLIDGSGLLGDSFFNGGGSILFTFDAGVLGMLPTHVGIVWTDGAGDTSFEAFDELGNSLGPIGPVAIADGSFNGETAEDHFFGAIHPSGISRIFIQNSGGGIEVDHLQYGGPQDQQGPVIPEPSSMLLLGSGLAGLVALRRRKRI